MSSTTRTEHHVQNTQINNRTKDIHTTTFSNILIATDGHRKTTHAIETALSIAGTHEATLHALYVVDPPSSMSHYDLVVERFERDGEHAVEAVVNRGAEHGLTVCPVFRYGSPHNAILDYAADHNIDLIIVGGHRRTGLRMYIEPKSVADLVARRADVPVLIVREPPRTVATPST